MTDLLGTSKAEQQGFGLSLAVVCVAQEQWRAGRSADSHLHVVAAAAAAAAGLEAPLASSTVGCPSERCVTVCQTGNDPSAGSPTETLLRLLLPLDARV